MRGNRKTNGPQNKLPFGFPGRSPRRLPGLLGGTWSRCSPVRAHQFWQSIRNLPCVLERGWRIRSRGRGCPRPHGSAVPHQETRTASFEGVENSRSTLSVKSGLSPCTPRCKTLKCAFHSLMMRSTNEENGSEGHAWKRSCLDNRGSSGGHCLGDLDRFSDVGRLWGPRKPEALWDTTPSPGHALAQSAPHDNPFKIPDR